MPSSLVWINARDAHVPPEDRTRVRSQAGRHPRQRKRGGLHAARVDGPRPHRPLLKKGTASPGASDGRTSSIATSDSAEKAVVRVGASGEESCIAVASDGSALSTATATPSPPLPPAIYSLAATQQALFAAFLRGHFSKDSTRSFLIASSEGGGRIPRSRSFLAATNALGLLQINSTNANARLAHEGRKYYGMMLKLLQQELDSEDLDLTAVLGTVNHLLLCELYSAIPQDTASLQAHLAGMARLIVCLTTLSDSPRLSTIMLRSARFILLAHSLVVRHPGPVGIVSGTLRQQKGGGQTRLERLLRPAMDVPALLYATDNMIQSDSTAKEALALIEKICRLESKLRTWLEQNPPPGVDDRESPSLSEESLNSSPKKACLLRLERGFGPANRFASFNEANIYSLCWICLLLLEAALIDLDHFAGARFDSPPLAPLTDRDSRGKCARNAVALARNIPFLVRSAGGNISQATSIRLPLFFLQLAFHKTDSLAELECVRDAEGDLRWHFRALNWDALLPWGFLDLIWKGS